MDTYSATSVGSTLLVVAAAIVVLTFVFRGPLWRSDLGSEPPLHNAAVASKEKSPRIAASPLPPSGAATAPDSTLSPTARAAADRREVDESLASIGTKQQPQQTLQAGTRPSRNERSSLPLSSMKDIDPWAAIRCVYVFNPDPSEPQRWKIENGCDLPVVVVLSNGSMILPAPMQRPVTLEEQTIRTPSVQAACFVTHSDAIALIGAPSEERSTAAWREQFALARASDGCLSSR